MNFTDTLKHHLDSMCQKDFESFMATVSKESITLIMPNGSLHKDYQAFYDLHQGWFQDPDWSIRYEIISSQEGQDMSLALLSIDYNALDENQQEDKMTSYLNLIFKKYKEKWLLIHDQNTLFK